MNNDYKKSVNCARKILQSYGVNSIEGKDAEDFASESYNKCLRYSGHNIRCRIIDAVRKKTGRPGKIKKIREWQTLPTDLFTLPAEPVLSVDELVNSLGVEPRTKEIVRLLASGLTKTETAKVMGVTQTRITQIIKEQIIPAYQKALNTKWS